MRSRALLHQLAALLAMLAVFNSLGGSWILAQSVAWTRMAIEYSQKTNLATGLKQTFDGKHPCRLCQRIARQQGADTHPNPTRIELRFETYSLPNFAHFEPHLVRTPIEADFNPGLPDFLSLAPPVPPPRHFA